MSGRHRDTDHPDADAADLTLAGGAPGDEDVATLTTDPSERSGSSAPLVRPSEGKGLRSEGPSTPASALSNLGVLSPKSDHERIAAWLQDPERHLLDLFGSDARGSFGAYETCHERSRARLESALKNRTESESVTHL